MKATANTTIRLGLLNLPVGVCKATGELDDVKFNLGDAQGRKLTQQYVDVDGNVVPVADRTKTIDGHIIDKDALESIAEATKLDGLDILKIESRERFSGLGSISWSASSNTLIVRTPRPDLLNAKKQGSMRNSETETGDRVHFSNVRQFR